MPKYEIMLIISPDQDEKYAKEFITKILGDSIKSSEKLERNELAYPINNSTKALYYSVLAETDGDQIKEFVRISNITKDIWRYLVINLDEEKKDKKVRKRTRPVRPGGDRPRAPRPGGDRTWTPRPDGDRPRAPRPAPTRDAK